MSFIFSTLMAILAVFLILLVLVQRGRGGGLTGALGGMGGSSAFGAKAGDIFTRITIVTAAIWIIVCAGAVYWAIHRSDRLGAAGSGTVPHSASTDTLPGGPAVPSPTGGATATGEKAPPPSDSAPASDQPAPETK